MRKLLLLVVCLLLASIPANADTDFVHVGSATNRGVIVALSDGDVWNGSAYVAMPGSGNHPGANLVTPTQLGSSIAWKYTVPTAAESEDYVLLIYSGTTVDVADLPINQANKPDDTPTDASVNAEVDTALADIHLDHLLAADYDPSSQPGTSTALLNELVGNDSGVSRFTTNALELGPVATGFSTHSAADVNTAVEAGQVGIDTTLIAGLMPASGPLPNASDVNTEIDTALADIHLDHLLAADYDPSSKPGVSTALLNELVENDGGVSRLTANALEEAGGGSDATEANQLAIVAAIDALNDLSAAQVNAEVDTALTDYDPPTRAELTTDTGSITTAIGNLNDISAADVNAQVDTALIDYDPPTNAELTSASGTITLAISNLNDLSGAEVNAQVDAALAEYDGPTDGEVTTLFATLNDVNTADVQAAAEAAIAAKLPSGSTLIAGAGGTATDLDDISSGDASSANQSTIITHLTDIKGATWASTDSLEEIRDRGDSAWITGSGGTPISPSFVNDGHTWSFTRANQLTGRPVIRELDGFDGLVAMDVGSQISTDVSISTATATVSPETDITVGTVALAPNKRKVHIPLDVDAADTYTLTVTITTTDGQTLIRKGVIRTE